MDGISCPKFLKILSSKLDLDYHWLFWSAWTHMEASSKIFSRIEVGIHLVWGDPKYLPQVNRSSISNRVKLFPFICMLLILVYQWRKRDINKIKMIRLIWYFFTEVFIESFSNIFQILQGESTTRGCYVRNPIGRESDFTTNGALIIISSRILNIFWCITMYKYVFTQNRRLKISTINFSVHIITKNNILVPRGSEKEMPLKTSKNKKFNSKQQRFLTEWTLF